ncbi:hypothetical protein [Pontibaca salina]|uniref:Uncharacterized protein n=1 Tax=Pontibaca salina TaxID=2795731 RepID=A0A934HRI6_9RHOB|nr:hypothetical protein [Pontibaca salina]MBI6630127.1 hypothetical protein [Pontibaca salina]
MSAPKTDIEKQTRRHRAALIGMWVAVGLALGLFVIWLVWVFAYPAPETDARAIEAQGEAEITAPAEPVTPESKADPAPAEQ